MRPPIGGLRTLLICAAVGLSIAAVSTQQTPPRVAGDGLLRSELSLAGQTAVLAILPNLRAADPAHAALLAPTPGVAPGRLRIGHLETTGVLRVGSLELQGATASAAAPVPPAGVRYDLWLKGAASGWELEVIDSSQAAVGQVALTRSSALASDTLAVAIVPEARTVARLLLRWGPYQAAADVHFATPSRRRRSENGEPNTTVNRRHDEDTSALSRGRLLAQRNETAATLPNGSRLSVSFQRTFVRGEAPDANRGRGLDIDGPDFARLMATPNDAVVMLAEAPVPRLRNEVALRFGQFELATGNQVPGFAGSYGLWLKRDGASWRLVFNDQPDAWGSQYDPKFDRGAIALSHSDGHATARPFAIGLLPGAPDRGRLVIVWGPHEWTADFSTGG
jgi:hypothetical protein